MATACHIQSETARLQIIPGTELAQRARSIHRDLFEGYIKRTIGASVTQQRRKGPTSHKSALQLYYDRSRIDLAQ